MGRKHEQTTEELVAISGGRQVAGVLGELEPHLQKMGNTLISATIGRLQRGELSEAQALEAWRELASYRKVLRRLETQMTMGTEAAQELARRTEEGKNA